MPDVTMAGKPVHDSQSDMFAGALGGFVIGSIMGSLVGSLLGIVVGTVVGVFVGAFGEAAPAAKPNLVIPENKQSPKKGARALPAIAGRRIAPATGARRKK